MGTARKFNEVVDKIPCFTCPKFEMSEWWTSILNWTPYCWASRTTIDRFYEKCPLGIHPSTPTMKSDENE